MKKLILSLLLLASACVPVQYPISRLDARETTQQVARATLGRELALIPHSNGGMASTDTNRVVMYDESVLELPYEAQMMVFMHELGHIVLEGGSEYDADKFSGCKLGILNLDSERAVIPLRIVKRSNAAFKEGYNECKLTD